MGVFLFCFALGFFLCFIEYYPICIEDKTKSKVLLFAKFFFPDFHESREFINLAEVDVRILWKHLKRKS